ncbi:Eco57I restriction-modification methylase domain-containing protein [Maridesulfovibrio hydrothermalis]|uniref:site-specific DNA-methyltransferase (adenine-specific) n=1 Tax=Maridesulfovibrio hydrothermalis AM13 = DSM 14728 TaxID=1121451 RepID=L0R9K2_9BACT|nr:Eco57I restriction-modification methylase domain-containing protein [Maridesulfovibrio hydrothermalis]CCO22271.1 Modification methylase BsuBI [Maridesulfovibrio hydrothermalis AM13 = DSM 14728]
MPEPLLKENTNLILVTESKRKAANGKLEPKTKSALGQYMTPANVASFMASLFPEPVSKKISLLDPGAGVGSLTSAFVDHFCKLYSNICIDLTAYEIDSVMQEYLRENLSLCKTSANLKKCKFSWKLINRDFVVEASRMIASIDSLWKEDVEKFSHCIMNPPYKKILSSSRHRLSLRTAGIETVNLYSAFVALSVLLMESKGYLVAIIPRSFCNGPYYRPFRELILKYTAIKRIHLFDSRSKAFKEDKVLQENIIIALEKNAEQGDVIISTSTDDTFSDIAISDYPFSSIVKESDSEFFIHIPTSPDDILELSENFRHSLSDVGINISTGPVVDFRMKDHLRQMPEKGAVPLLYPCHFKKDALVWPIENGKKPNAIMTNSDTKKWLYPNGFYTVVRRFSSKEEKRRIVASIVDPRLLDGAENIGLENHLNVFHKNKKPLSENLARGLVVYLNSTIVDEYFRRFSGHTQVNATDLKLMTYPSRHILSKLGEWAKLHAELTQEMIDNKMESFSK